MLVIIHQKIAFSILKSLGFACARPDLNNDALKAESTMLALLASILKFVPVPHVTTSIFLFIPFRPIQAIQAIAPSTPTWIRDNLIPGSNLSKQLPQVSAGETVKLQDLFWEAQRQPSMKNCYLIPNDLAEALWSDPSHEKKITRIKQAGITWHNGNTLKLFLQRA